MDGSKGGAVREIEGRERLTGGRGGGGGGGGWRRLDTMWEERVTVTQTLTLTATVIKPPSGLWARPIYTDSTQIANRIPEREIFGTHVLFRNFRNANLFRVI
jgi:hypothetical protein